MVFARTDYDCYRILGLKANASLEEVKASYRDLARKYHPDSRSQEVPQSPGATEASMRAKAQKKNASGGVASEDMSRRQQELNLQKFLIVK